MPKPDVGPIRLRVHKLSVGQREALLIRVERLTELPLLVVSFIMVPILVGPFVWDLSTAEKATFAFVNALIWATFARSCVQTFDLDQPGSLPEKPLAGSVDRYRSHIETAQNHRPHPLWLQGIP